VGRPALILAALAAEAAPELRFTRYLPVETPDVDQLELLSDSGETYLLRVPNTAGGERELALEIRILASLQPYAEQLPFQIPIRRGDTKDQVGYQATLFTALGGKTANPERLGPGEFSRSFAAALAGIHSLPLAVVRDGGLPDFDATAILHRKVAELDRMAATGRVPADLLNRWERAMEDVNLFRYRPTVVHGGITSSAIHLDGQRVIGLSNWQNLRIGDPAEDFVWLIQGTLENTQSDTVLTYRTIRSSADENLQQRATLYSELAVGQWLLHLLDNESDTESIAEAEDMLADLRSDLDSGKLPELKSSSFIGMAAATSLLPEITRINTGAIEVVTETSSSSDELF